MLDICIGGARIYDGTGNPHAFPAGISVNASNDRDNEENVRVLEKDSIQVAQSFTYIFPAHSATVIQIAKA